MPGSAFLNGEFLCRALSSSRSVQGHPIFARYSRGRICERRRQGEEKGSITGLVIREQACTLDYCFVCLRMIPRARKATGTTSSEASRQVFFVSNGIHRLSYDTDLEPQKVGGGFFVSCDRLRCRVCLRGRVRVGMHGVSSSSNAEKWSFTLPERVDETFSLLACTACHRTGPTACVLHFELCTIYTRLV